jgi:hypothetical protein
LYSATDRCVCEDRYDEHAPGGGSCNHDIGLGDGEVITCPCPEFEKAPALTLEDLGVDVL